MGEIARTVGALLALGVVAALRAPLAVLPILVVMVVAATRSALRRARTPYAHARDDDPMLVVRELQRAIGGT